MINNPRRITICAILAGASLALFIIEMLVPPFSFAPGAKIGLANIITLFMLSNRQVFNVSDCISVLVVRCFLACIITGRIMSVVFSLTGGIAALFIMLFMMRIIGERHIVAVSISGAIVHNIVQIFVALFMYGTFSIIYYIPTLFIAGTACGSLTGMCILLINRNKRLKNIFNSR